MKRRFQVLSVGMLICSVLLVGCGDDKSSPATGSSSPTADPHAGHDHSSHEDASSHGAVSEGLQLKIGETVLAVTIGGTPKPGANLHVEALHKAGPMPTLLRLWIGEESGVGSMKVKAEPHGDHFHTHVTVPNDASAPMKLWAQMESAEGEPVLGSLQLGGE